MALSSGVSHNILRNLKLPLNAAFMSTKAGSNPEKPKLNNDKIVCQEFKSRNPRNLEFLRVARKPSGYHLDKPGREFWNKLVVKASHHSVKAEIIHNSGTVVASASSAEWGIKKQLYRYTDSCAFKAVGAVLAERVQECGIDNVCCAIEAEEGTKMDFLLKAVQAGGVSLEEKPRFLKPDPFRKVQATPPWEKLKMM